MVRTCCICGEKKDKDAADSQIRFFRIPSSKSPIYNLWAKTIKDLKNKPSDRLKKNAILCSQHFEKSCFIVKKNTLKLKKGSLPTIRDPPQTEKANLSEKVTSTEVTDAEKREADEKLGSSALIAQHKEHLQNGHPSSIDEEPNEISSESLSPPTLHPLPEVNSDYEEDVEEPPDLEFFSISNGAEDVTYLTNLSEYDAVKTDHIGSVADILGADFLAEESLAQEIERSEASSKAEIVEVDGQTILSFASAEELEEYVTHCEPPRPLARTLDSIDKPCQPTPSLTPSPCSSPFPSSEIKLPSDTATSAPRTSSADTSSGSNGRSPVPNHSEDSALPDQEISSIMETDTHEAVVMETLSREEEASPEVSNGAVTGNQTCTPAVIEESALRYSESEDSMTGANGIEDEDKTLATPKACSSVPAAATDAVSTSPPRKSPPVLNIDGTITPEIAAFAVSAIALSPNSMSDASTAQTEAIAPKKSTGPNRGRRSGPTPNGNRTGRKSEPPIFDKSTATDEPDEIITADMAVSETAFEDLVVLEEEYCEEYDVPAKTDLPAASCEKLSCRLGCVCKSLEEAGSRRKQGPEHCSLPECMVECVCGYKRGKLTGKRSFVSLLKGNESFYSKINWSSERSRRERKVPERYSEYQLETDAIKQPTNRSSSNSRSNSRPSSPTYKPPSSLHRQYQNRTARNQQIQQPATPTVSPKKRESFKLKISTDEIKLLRWDSYVSLSKVYVAPDQEIMCMDHSTYSCPCIASNRRIIRIPSKFVPPNVRIGDGSSVVSPTHPKANQAKTIPATGNSSRNVAKKHTHPIMRTASNKEKRGLDGEQSIEDATPKPSAMSKMRKLLQDERFQLQKLITQEKTRAFDDEIDLTVKQGQTVQLVAWIRFHSIYHADKMHIRFLSRRSGPVILVMRPTEIVAADITCDIQEMKGKENAPEIVKELLDPCISPEETSRYAFLLCDGIKWELVGCLSLQASNSSSSDSVSADPSSMQPLSPKREAPSYDLPEPEGEVADLSLSDTASRTPSKRFSNGADSDSISRTISPATQRRLDAMEERRRVLEEKLAKINSRLNFQPTKTTQPVRPTKLKLVNLSSTQPTPASAPSNTDETMQPDSPAPPSTTPGLPSAQRRELSENAAVPIHAVLPDYFPTLFTRPTFMTDLSTPDHRPGDYYASEQLVQFSKFVMQTQENYLKDFSNKAKMLFQAKHPSYGSAILSPTSSPLPSETRRIPEMSLLKETSCFDTEDSTMDEQSLYQNIRMVPPQETPHNAPPTSFNFRSITPLTGFQRNQDTNVTESTPLSTIPKTQEVKNTCFPSNVILRKLTPINPSVPSQSGTSKTVVVGSIVGIIPTSSSSVLKVPSSQRAILPKITSVSSMAFGESQVITATQQPKTTMVKIGGQIVAAKPIVFPEAISIEISAVQAPNSKPSQLFKHRMKVVLDVIAEEHKVFCPSPTNMLLPMHNEEDEWSLVAVDAVPQAGLPIPGLQVIVPRNVLEKALSTALERQARVSFPLHVQAIPSNPVLKKGFGVYATPQLPRHAFLGPFPANYLKSKAALPVYIKLLAVTTDPATEAALKTITQEPVVIELGSPVSSSAAVEDSVVIEKVVANPRQSLEPSTKKQDDAVLIEPADVPDAPSSTDLSCPEKFTEVFKSANDNHDLPIEDSVFISTGVEGPSDEVEVFDNLPGMSLSITKVESTREKHAASGSSDLVIVEDADKENEAMEEMNDLGNESDDPDYVDPSEKKWQDEDSRWLESVAHLNKNTKSTSHAVSEQLSQDIIIESVDTDSKSSSDYRRKRQAEETVDDDSLLPRRSPKRTRRPTEKARIFAEELKANRSSSASSQSSQVEPRRQASFSPPTGSRKSTFQRELHIIKEQERRGLLSKLFRDLDSLLAPNSEARSKIVVLKHATNTLKALEEQSKAMDNLYGVLKARRNTLLRQRFKLFNELTSDVKPIFKCLLDSTPLPERHLSVEAGIGKRHKSSAQQKDRSQDGLHDEVDSIDIVIC